MWRHTVGHDNVIRNSPQSRNLDDTIARLAVIAGNPGAATAAYSAQVTCASAAGFGANPSLARRPAARTRGPGAAKRPSAHRYRLRSIQQPEDAVETKITVKTCIKFNGREYTSLDDMPADVRRDYERALAMVGRGTSATHPFGAGTGTLKIVFNGQEYSSADQMPADVRKLYDGVMAALDADRSGLPDFLEPSGVTTQREQPEYLAPLGGGAAAPETSSRIVIACILIATLLLIVFLIAR